MDGNLELFIKLGHCRAGCGRIDTRDVNEARGSLRWGTGFEQFILTTVSPMIVESFSLQTLRHVCVVRLAPFPVGRVYSDSLGLPFD